MWDEPCCQSARGPRKRAGAVNQSLAFNRFIHEASKFTADDECGISEQKPEQLTADAQLSLIFAFLLGFGFL